MKLCVVLTLVTFCKVACSGDIVWDADIGKFVWDTDICDIVWDSDILQGYLQW